MTKVNQSNVSLENHCSTVGDAQTNIYIYLYIYIQTNRHGKRKGPVGCVLYAWPDDKNLG